MSMHDVETLARHRGDATTEIEVATVEMTRPSASCPILDLFVHIHQDDQQQTRLDAAATLARRLGAHLTCVQTAPYVGVVAGDVFGGSYYVPEAFEAQQKIDGEERARIEAWLKTRVDSHGWVHATGEPVSSLVQAACLADLLIVSAGHYLTGHNKPRPLAGRLAVTGRAPLLVMPEGEALDLDRPAVVLWNGSFEAAQALRFAVPMLALAPEVEIVVAGTGEVAPIAADAQAYLARRGVASVVNRLRHPMSKTSSQVLEDFVERARPGLIVMGAYGHTRALEVVFGGVTQSMIEDMPAPLLLAH